MPPTSAPALPPSFEEEAARLLSCGQTRDACGLLVEVLGPQLRGFLRGVLGSDHAGDDLFQDTCVALLDALPRFEGRSSLRTFAYAVASHRVRRYLRRYSRRHVIRLDTDRALALPADSTAATVEALSRERKLQWILQQLCEADREVYILRTERDFSFHQIGQITHSSEAAAKQRYHRVVKRLKDAWGRLPDNEREG